ncbi:MAG: hypothetical protein L3J06_04660, partial [Cyclobacteriaceae bacterium]|nr:hypothetical protein [Cyclobacteriaceae bacterium]
QDLKAYYERKVSEGKNKMSVINAIRNKLIHRVFTCVNENRKYLYQSAWLNHRNRDKECCQL